MVTHNPALGPQYDKIILLRDGRIDNRLFEWEIARQQQQQEVAK